MCYLTVICGTFSDNFFFLLFVHCKSFFKIKRGLAPVFLLSQLMLSCCSLTSLVAYNVFGDNGLN